MSKAKALSRVAVHDALVEDQASTGRRRLPADWQTQFLDKLAETSCVTTACDAVGVPSRHAYKARRTKPEFARRWRDALYEGYEHLELETLRRLRTGEGSKHDIANAVRVLAAHRDTIGRERARRDNRSEREVLDSIDAMIDDMRSRAAANDKLLADGGDDES